MPCFSALLFFATSLAAQNSQAVLQDALKVLGGTASFEVWKYDGTRLIQKNAIPAAKPGEGSLKTATAAWKYSINSLQQMKDGAIKFKVKFKLERGAESSAAVAVSFNIAGWSIQNYVLIPGAV